MHILKRLSGAQVASQFRAITEGGTIEDRLPTPTQSPRSSKSLGTFYHASRSDHKTSNVTLGAPPATPSKAHLSAGQEEIEDNDRTPTPTSPFTIISQSSGNSTRPAGLMTSSETMGRFQEGFEEDDDQTPTPSNPFSRISKTNAAEKENRRSQAFRPQPILKKESSTGSGKSSKSAAFVLPSALQPGPTAAATSGAAMGSHGESDVKDPQLGYGSPPQRRHTSTRFSEEVAVSIPKASTSMLKATEKVSRSQGESTQKAGKRNPVVFSSTRASKRRPGVTRQRSSHIVYDSNKAKPSPSPPASSGVQRSESISADISETSNQDVETIFSEPRRAASPHTSEISRQRSLEAQELVQRAGTEKKTSTGSDVGLDDSQYRSGFAERETLNHRPFTHLPSFARKSSASAAIANSYQASGLLDVGSKAPATAKGKGKEVFHNEVVPLKAPAPSGPEIPREETPQDLPRTKSQLTLLLERNRTSGQEPTTAEEKEKHC